MPTTERAYRSTLSALFLASLGLNLWQAFAFVSPLKHIYSDMGGYLERAWRLAVAAPFMDFDVFYPAGTSYIYALFFSLLGFESGAHAIALFQCLLLASNTVLIAILAKELFESRTLALLLSSAAFLYWPFAAQASFFMAEPVFEFFLLSALLLFLRCSRSGGTLSAYLFLGLLFGSAILIKGQGLCVLIAVLISAAAFKPLRPQPKMLAVLVLGALLLPALQMGVTSRILKKPALYLAANDAYNTYLGQSRREGVGCIDTKSGVFYVFHNNNAGLDYPFLEPMMLPISILEREAFQEKTKELWKENPSLQVLRSLHNVVELFEINPRWPMRNDPRIGKADVVFQWLFLIFFGLPACYTIVGALIYGRFRWQSSLLALPIAGLAALIFLTMGQPRYLLPFQYFVLLLSGPFYLDLFSLSQGETGKAPAPKVRADKRLVILFVILFCIGFLVSRALPNTRPPAPSLDTFESLPEDDNQTLLLLNLGENGELSKTSVDTFQFKLKIRGFEVVPGTYLLPQQSSIYTRDKANLTIELFPQERGRIDARSIGVYLLDEPKGFRVSKISSGSETRFGENLRSGKWIFIPIDEKSRSHGRFTLDFERLFGSEVQLAAVMLRGRINDE